MIMPKHLWMMRSTAVTMMCPSRRVPGAIRVRFVSSNSRRWRQPICTVTEDSTCSAGRSEERAISERKGSIPLSGVREDVVVEEATG